ncbi:LLM class flavin-dependent oxidoreductase [Cellulomonas alba]|uniref:LLM class flavin-dependent oxidoreductase n=1 Tax=Cellulomonas alba TaxID=3053467 RepID=A0ABT7SCF7_9CELL|nr:LLM class flavin-dependent oxidoreductase [Cellulomonas alba]MDM7853873.1 LLM class flavin-dependent oxidoreductase [Cellulomonas alba]
MSAPSTASARRRGPLVHLGVDLTDAGAHPAAWRASGSRPERVFDAARLTELVARAQSGLLDFVALDDAFTLQPRSGGVRGRLDAALVAARLAPRSAGIGLVATVDTTHTEPFHVSKAIATIDHVSQGRAGWQVAWSTSDAAAAAFGRKPPQSEADAIEEADEAAHVIARLWDSWEDDAEIRDVATGRFVDREKLHYVDHEGIRFAVKGPSITPRPPQGRPPVVVPVTGDDALRLAASRADVARVQAATAEEAGELRDRLRSAAQDAERDPDELRVLVDANVVLGADEPTARARFELLQDLDDARWDGSLAHVGTAHTLTSTVEEWVRAGAADGFVLRPASLATDLDAVVAHTVPALQRLGLFRTAYPGTTLRDTLGLARPANVFATSA